MNVPQSMTTFLQNEPNWTYLQQLNFPQEVNKCTAEDFMEIFQLLLGFPEHRKLLVDQYSWEIFDRLFELAGKEQDGNAEVLKIDRLKEVLALYPLREAELMIQEKFAISKSLNELFFLMDNIICLVSKKQEVTTRQQTKSIDFLMNVLSTLLKKFLEMFESLSEEDVDVLLDRSIILAVRISSDIQISVKVKSIATGFMIQLLMNHVIKLSNTQQRQRVIINLSEGILQIWDYQYPIIFNHLRREIFRLHHRIIQERKREKFYRQWSLLQSQQSLHWKDLKVLSSLSEEIISGFLTTLTSLSDTNRNNTFHIVNEVWSSFWHQESNEFISYANIYNNEMESLCISRRFPWTLTGIAILTYTILSASEFNPPFSRTYKQNLIQDSLPYLLDIPLIQSTEALNAFNYTYGSNQEDSHSLYFFPCLITLQSSKRMLPKRESDSHLSLDYDMLKDLIDDEISIAYTTQHTDSTIAKISTSNYQYILNQSHLHWKVSQSIISNIVQCPSAILRETTFHNLRKYFHQFEMKSKLFLLIQLMEICPYSQIKALLVDFFKSIVQQFTFSLSSLFSVSSIQMAKSVAFEGSIQQSKFLQVSDLPRLESVEQFNEWMDRIVAQRENWIIHQDYKMIVNKYPSKEKIDQLIYEYIPICVGIPDELFWSKTVVERLFFTGASEELNEMDIDKILDLGEYFNAKVMLLLFYLMKLESELRAHLFMVYKFSPSTSTEKLELILFQIFFHQKGVLSLERTFQWFYDLYEYLDGWEGEIQKLFIANNHSTIIQSPEYLKMDILLSNLVRCREKLQLICLQLSLIPTES